MGTGQSNRTTRGMLLKEYGALIDKHDAVIRINVLENAKYYANLGKETTYRVLSYKMAKDVCCVMPPEKHPPDNKHMSYLVWFPAMRKEIVHRIRQRSGHFTCPPGVNGDANMGGNGGEEREGTDRFFERLKERVALQLIVFFRYSSRSNRMFSHHIGTRSKTVKKRCFQFRLLVRHHTSSTLERRRGETESSRRGQSRVVTAEWRPQNCDRRVVTAEL